MKLRIKISFTWQACQNKTCQRQLMLICFDYLQSIMFIYKGILCLFICVFSTVGHVTLTHCSDWSNWIFLTLCENKPRFQYSISVISSNKHISGRNKKNWNIFWQNLKQSLCIILTLKDFPTDWSLIAVERVYFFWARYAPVRHINWN